MSRESISVIRLTDELNKMVQDYGEEMVEKADNIVRKNANALNKEIPNTTAFKDGNGSFHLRNAFKVSKNTKDEKKSYIVSASTKHHKYSIVHLVEFGHSNYWFRADKSGSLSFVPPHPFLVPLAEKYSQQMAAEIEKLIAGKQ